MRPAPHNNPAALATPRSRITVARSRLTLCARPFRPIIQAAQLLNQVISHAPSVIRERLVDHGGKSNHPLPVFLSGAVKKMVSRAGSIAAQNTETQIQLLQALNSFCRLLAIEAPQFLVRACCTWGWVPNFGRRTKRQLLLGASLTTGLLPRRGE